MVREFPSRLTQAQKRKAQQGFIYFATINALSYALLAESVLVLFALQLGATDFHIGLLSSYVHLTMVFVLLGKVMVTRWGAARTYSSCWFLRNLTAGTFILAPWIWVHVSHGLGLIFLMAASFIFFIFRAMGLSAENVLINDITSLDDRGRFIGRWQFFAYFAMLGMLIAVSFWLGGTPSFGRFQIVFAVGCVLGMAASSFMFNIPESDGPKISSREPMLRALNLLYREKKLRYMLFAWMAITCGIQLIAPFQILAVKNGYLISDRAAVFFVVLQMLGMVAGSFPIALLIDRSGPRPILIINVLGLALLALLWAFSPEKISYWYSGTLFFMVGYCIVSIYIAVAHYFQNSVPRESILNLNMLILVLQGMAAGLVGTFFGGGLLETFRNLGMAGMTVYHTYFLMVAAALVGTTFVVVKLEPLAERRVKEVLGMMFSVRDWRALLSLQRLSDFPKLGETQELIGELGSLGSGVGESALLEYLDSPLFTVRTAALEALDKLEFGPETGWRLIEEIKDGEFSTAFMAADILGRHRVSEAISTLRESLYSNDFFLQGKAMVALAQLGDLPSYGRITEIFSTTFNPRLVIHGARALYLIGERDNARLLLSRLDPRGVQAEHDEIMHSAFALLGWGEESFRLMTLFNRNQQLGLDTLTELVEKRLEALAGRITSLERLILRAALDEAADREVSTPEALLALLRQAAGLKAEKAKYLDVLLGDEATVIQSATPRLRFSLTALACYVYLEEKEG